MCATLYVIIVNAIFSFGGRWSQALHCLLDAFRMASTPMKRLVNESARVNQGGLAPAEYRPALMT